MQKTWFYYRSKSQKRSIISHSTKYLQPLVSKSQDISKFPYSSAQQERISIRPDIQASPAMGYYVLPSLLSYVHNGSIQLKSRKITRFFL